MSGVELFAFGVVLFTSVIMGLIPFAHCRREQSYTPKGKAPIYLPRYEYFCVSYIALPLLIVLADYVVTGIPSMAIQVYGATIMLMGVYYGLLLLLRPLYRKILRAESCAFLWILVWLLFYLRYAAYMGDITPRWLITLPFSYPDARVIGWAFGIWLTGFAAVMLWSIVSHICYRRWLLRGANLLREEVAEKAYTKQMQMINFSPEYVTLWASKKTKTPVSIGLFWKTTCVVLPEKKYTVEELEMIFHHELVHICRRDSLTKLLMTFSTALMWFNPLVWLAMRACADDLELSCDEAVLHGRPGEERRKYATLLLQTTACERGFTSCLSASARALRYRLKGVVKPGKRIAGSVVVALLSFVLLMSFLYLGVRFQPGPADYRLFENEDLSQYEVGDILITVSPDSAVHGQCIKDQELLEYVGSLSLRWVSGAYDVYQGEYIQISIGSKEKCYFLAFGKTHLRVLTVITTEDGSQEFNTEYYELDDNTNLDYIRSCVGVWSSSPRVTERP